jgi:hypothetical protein
MPILEYGPRQKSSVTTLMSVGRGPDGLGQTAERLLPGAAIKDGLVVMGAATLLGLSPRTARLLGIIGFGFGLIR